MIKLFGIWSLTALLNLQSVTGPVSSQAKVDLTKSKITWLGKKVTGQHHGNISLKSANLEFNKSKLTGGEFEMDMNSITCNDMQGEYANKLVNHLKSDDFFSSAKHPVAKFKISKVSPGSSANSYKVEGTMTIKGITAPVMFDAKVENNSASARIVIDRTKYDIKYGSGSFFDNLGDKAIDNNFELDVTLSYSM